MPGVLTMPKETRIIGIWANEFQGNEPENIEAAELMAKGMLIAMNMEAMKSADDLKKGNPEQSGKVKEAVQNYRVRVLKVLL